jgi:hypothetical protein
MGMWKLCQKAHPLPCVTAVWRVELFSQVSLLSVLNFNFNFNLV